MTISVTLWLTLWTVGVVARNSKRASDVLVLGGNFMYEGRAVTLLQYDLGTGAWAPEPGPKLVVYGQESAGTVMDMSVDQTEAFNALYVVGEFDSIYSMSQITYCSIGDWDGRTFSKVGEGLCPHREGHHQESGPGRMDRGMQVRASAVGPNGVLFVGGTFKSHVWNGEEFVSVENVGLYDGRWLELEGGPLTCSDGDCDVVVSTLHWDDSAEVLYLGGYFDRRAGTPCTAGLAMWTAEDGLRDFPGGGLSTDTGSTSATSLHFDPASETLFVAGRFTLVNGTACRGIAAWHGPSNEWQCLFAQHYAMDPITTMMVDEKNHFLYVAGKAERASVMNLNLNSDTPYQVAEVDLKGYIRSKRSGNSSSSSSSSSSSGGGGHGGGHGDLSNSNSTHTKNRPDQGDTRRLQQAWVERGMMQSSPPVAATTKKATRWRPSWQWLDGFEGVDGAISRLLAGLRGQDGKLFIVGAFNPGVLVWSPHKEGGRIDFLGEAGDVNGLVSTIVQAQMHLQMSPEEHAVTDAYEVPVNYTFLLFFAAMLSGLVLGVGFAISCYNKRGLRGLYSLIPNFYPTDHEISLTTLSGSAGESIDFRHMFEKAMHARHLPSHENLMVIDPMEISLSKIIGEGSFGRVWSGNWRLNTVAVKEFVFAQAVISGGGMQRQHVVEEIVGEAGIMACLRHPKILQLYGCSLTMQAIWIVNELCEIGSLRMLLTSTTDMTLATKASLCLDVADGMLYLHTRTPPIIHRDLKSHNIFVTESRPGHFVAKIGDWGSARAIALTASKSMTHGVGTACWLAPEVIHSAHCSKASDVYAFGIVLWEAFTRGEVYEGLSAAQIISKVANAGLRPHVPPKCPWAAIMQDCWLQDPTQRPSFSTILAVLSEVHTDVQLRRGFVEEGEEGRAGTGAGAGSSAGTANGSVGGGGGGGRYGSGGSTVL